ncbi:unnamed protein product [Blepharisma stoltei]|uniref:Uncharacterized protein n=1 Tax=Blepharisma stoltei TaxID=1481888 RepID=A0AAU9K0T9_9CILI|nr:unnamed protein product [Blepharisma stoltei]
MNFVRLGKLERKVQKLCLKLHQGLFDMQDDSDESMMSVGEVKEIHPLEAMAHVTEAIKELLVLKRSLKTFKENENFETTKNYQKALQKLEAEVREHFKIESQLKLYIDSTKQKIEDNKKLLDRGADELDKEKEILMKELATLDEEVSLAKKAIVLQDTLDQGEILKEPESEDVSSPESEKALKIVAKNKSLEIEIKKLREQIKEQEWENKEILRQKNEAKKALEKYRSGQYNPELSIAEFYKLKFEEKCLESIELQRKIKDIQSENKKLLSYEVRVNPHKNSSRSHSPMDAEVSATDRQRSISPLIATKNNLSQSHKRIPRNTSVEKRRRTPSAERRTQQSYITNYKTNRAL